MKCSNEAAFLGTTVKDLPKRWFFFCQKLMLLMLSNISKIHSLWSLSSLNTATIAAFPPAKFDLPEHRIALLTKPSLFKDLNRTFPGFKSLQLAFFYKKDFDTVLESKYEPEFGRHVFLLYRMS